jgi:monoamine oxidase
MRPRSGWLDAGHGDGTRAGLIWPAVLASGGLAKRGWKCDPSALFEGVVAGMARSEAAVVIIGAGAAGIGAARRLRDAGVDALLVEARSRIGGRAWTAEAGGFSVDLGCGWLHSADHNPWVAIAEGQGHAIDNTPPPWMRATGQLGIPAFERAAFTQALQRFRARSEEIGEQGPDRPAEAFLQEGDRWNPLLDAVSTYYSGAELALVSARDLARYDDDGVNWRVREGYGHVVAAHGVGLPVELDCAVTRIDHSGKGLRVETTKGTIEALAAIVTLSTALIAGHEDLFYPALPTKTEAAAALPLGLADKLFLSLSNAQEFEAEGRAFGDVNRTATAAYHLRPFGLPMIEAYFGGALAAELEAGGEAAFFDFARSELVGLFGADFARRVAPLQHHGWARDPFARGSYSYALPGKADCRAALAAPVDGRLFFAGEACSKHHYSTAHGALLTGGAAAEQAMAALGLGG